MRQRDYISPSSIATFYDDAEYFYLRYLTDEKMESDPQTYQMAAGSAFDSYCKHHLHVDIFGGVMDPAFDLDNLFTTMVEPHNRDKAREVGQHLFSIYKTCGAYQDLLFELANNSLNAPRMEFELKGTVNGMRDGVSAQFGDVILLGKPDLHWVTKDGFNVIFDWKVNGYYTKTNQSPHAGYVKLRQEQKSIGNYVGTQHKNAVLGELHGKKISTNYPLEVTDPKWAAQLSIYGWLLGIPVGTPFLTCIDQICGKCGPKGPGNEPIIRIAEHRTQVSQGFQFITFERAQHVWDVCKSGYIFRNMSEQDSKDRQAMLDLRAEDMKKNPDEMMQFKQKKSW